jgi:hypothetical protein
MSEPLEWDVSLAAIRDKSPVSWSEPKKLCCRDSFPIDSRAKCVD